MNRRTIVLVALVMVPLAYLALRPNRALHSALQAAQQWAANGEWVILHHTEMRWGNVHGDEGWIVRVRCRDQEWQKQEW